MATKRKKLWGSTPRFKDRKTGEAYRGNRFQALSDLDSDEESVEATGSNNALVVRIPPIVVDPSYNFTDVMKLLGNAGKYKRMSIGTKVMPNSESDYKDMVNKLKLKGTQFYSHPIRDQKRFKLILFGLPQLSIQTISEEFKSVFNIEPISITEVKTAKSNKDDALYAIEFDKNQVTKKDVRGIKYLCGIVIQWRNPLRRAQGPVQCSKCTMYGHGAPNCFRKSVCLGCGGPHDFSVCQLSKTTSEGPVVYKCFNCQRNNKKNINHRADDKRCPSREEYLEMRQRLSNNNRQINANRNKRPTYSFSEKDFPSNFNANDSNVIKSWPRLNNPNPGRIERSPSREYHPTDDNDISNEKLLEIYFEALDALQKCRNKFDKMRVLGMMLKNVI